MKKVISVVILFLCVGIIANAQPKMAVGINAGLAMPMGDFSDGFKTGFGGSGVFSYMVTPKIAVTGSIGYLTWTSKANSDLTFSSVPFLGGARFFFGNNPKIKFYGAAEIGFHACKIKVQNAYWGGTSSESDTNFGFGFGGGTLFIINKDACIDVNLKYNNISTSGSSSGFVTIMAGALITI